jgi:iron(III) transport system permease protein
MNMISGRFPMRWLRGNMAQRLGILIYFLIVLGPFVVLIAELVSSLAHGHSEWLMLALPTGRRLGLLINSIGFAAAVAAGGLILGTLGSTVLWQWDFGWRSYLRWLVIVLAPLPPYIHALVWTSAINALNSMLQSLGMVTIPAHGWIVCWWIQVMSLAPIAVGLSLAGLKAVEPAMIDSARMLRSDFFSLSRVMLPLAAPSLLAGTGILFLLSLMDYSVPSLLNLNVYALEIFAEYSASNEPVRALILSFPLLIIAVAVAIPSLATLKHAAQSSTWSIPVWKVAPVWPGWLVTLQKATIVVLAVQILLPLLILTTSAGTWKNLSSSIISSRNEIIFTFWINILVALLCIPIALSAARELVYANKHKSLLWILIIAPLAIPPPLIGIGLIAVWNKPLFSGVYGSSLMPVLAGLARFAPLAVMVLAAQFRRIDPLLIDAARILQPGRSQVWKHVWLPMLLPGILAAAGISFALTTGELGATLLVAPPGQSTLTMRIYNFLHYGASDAVAGLCLMMTAITLATGIVVAITLRGKPDRFSKIAVKRK